MSVSRLSEECAGIDGEVMGLGHVKVEPDHDACSGGHTRPGVLGGWVCSCECHVRKSGRTHSPDRCPRCGSLGDLVTAEGAVVVYACPNGRHDDWSVPLSAFEVPDA